MGHSTSTVVLSSTQMGVTTKHLAILRTWNWKIFNRNTIWMNFKITIFTYFDLPTPHHWSLRTSRGQHWRAGNGGISLSVVQNAGCTGTTVIHGGNMWKSLLQETLLPQWHEIDVIFVAQMDNPPIPSADWNCWDRKTHPTLCLSFSLSASFSLLFVYAISWKKRTSGEHHQPHHKCWWFPFLRCFVV